MAPANSHAQVGVQHGRFGRTGLGRTSREAATLDSGLAEPSGEKAQGGGAACHRTAGRPRKELPPPPNERLRFGRFDKPFFLRRARDLGCRGAWSVPLVPVPPWRVVADLLGLVGTGSRRSASRGPYSSGLGAGVRAPRLEWLGLTLRWTLGGFRRTVATVVRGAAWPGLHLGFQNADGPF